MGQQVNQRRLMHVVSRLGLQREDPRRPDQRARIIVIGMEFDLLQASANAIKTFQMWMVAKAIFDLRGGVDLDRTVCAKGLQGWMNGRIPRVAKDAAQHMLQIVIGGEKVGRLAGLPGHKVSAPACCIILINHCVLRLVRRPAPIVGRKPENRVCLAE
jgi:hypothetical protein